MQAVIYAGLRNGARDQQIFDALTYKHVIEVAKDFQLALGQFGRRRSASQMQPSSS